MEGAVPRTIVLDVLFQEGVGVTPLPDGGAELARDDVVEVQYMPELVPRGLIAHLSCIFEIPALKFYNYRMQLQ